MDSLHLTPDILLRAYAMGVFPMAESRDDPEIFWVDPRRRGILPLAGFHVSRSLARRIRRAEFQVSFDRDFAGVLSACAAREETWINAGIFELYCELHAMGFGHSIELWQDGDLAGGVYGVALGGAFFGESMFSRRTDASKVALVYLVDRLRAQGFALFDTQFVTPHLRSLGAQEIPRRDYRRLLSEALARPARFDPDAPVPDPQLVLQRISQTS
ncbi:leucyl/phenylalanyl-tRNA--protein transferase [Mangrovicoccus algicola]|uniref:Leucyl/phenylalanyl-tRNA--protein transferase n=1 Tax=Mangrovicoccus algicola TaxID=2771008 RepID=A0A8J6YTM1_9RHOB|nr:leucyl/phenylalanyl-tRNA--protein transferase [Mangrovicoccus algicola]MBE3639018.1 leucyl/phenylalanyl-tRNA--protein transferase [Mangrovicoccus algicola]